MTRPRQSQDREARTPVRRSAFTTFSTVARRELREVLGDASRHVTPLLQQLAKEHVSAREVNRRRDWAGASVYRERPGSAELAKAIAGLRIAIPRIDAYLSFASSDPMMGRTLGEIFTGVTEAERLGALRADMNARLRALEVQQRPFPRRRGRPIDIDRSWLTQDVAIVLRLSGVPVTTSRVGKFAKVIEIMLTEVYGAAPEDLFRLIRTVANFVNDGSEDDLRGIVTKVAQYYSDPAFWLRLASVR